MFSANALIQIFAFASQLFVAGILSPEDIGRIKIIQTFLSAFSVLAMMGFGSSTLKLCSDVKISDQRRNAIFQSAFIFTVISSLVVYSSILLINHFGILSKDSLIKSLIPLGLFPTISNAIFMLLIAYLQANKQMKMISRLTVSNKFISIAGIIIVTFFLGVKGYYIAYNISFVLMIVVALIQMRKKYDIRLSGISPKLLPYYFKQHRPYAFAITLGNLFSELGSYLDIILINFFITDMTNIGYYSFALTLTIIYRLLPSTVQQVSLPYFSSSLYDKTSFIQIYKKYNKLLYIAVSITFLGCVLFIPVFVHFVFKAKYDSSIAFFIPLSIGWSIRQLTQLQSAAIFGLGKAHYMTYTNSIMLFVNLLTVGAALIIWGLPGAAYASILTNAIFLTCSRTYFRRAVNEMSK
jgi:O-antigen/teichoic acid export membrane protein